MKSQKYTIGLDIGTNSVGWAVIDDHFKLVRGKKTINKDGNIRKSRTNLWGVRLFDEGEVAAARRLKRGQRRRIARRNERLRYLRGIFEEEIYKVDDSFFIRLDESFYQMQDKNKRQTDVRTRQGERQSIKQGENTFKYPLFKTEDEEKEYYKQFPTIYHLRKHLMENSETDIRKIYLGIHHILKYRGHFTNQGQKITVENIDIAGSLKGTLQLFEQASDFYFGVSDNEQTEANDILTNRHLSKSAKAFQLNEYFTIDGESIYKPENELFVDQYEELTERQKDLFIENKQKQLKALFTGIVGNSIDVKAIFSNAEYKPSNENQIPKAGDFKYSNENFDEKLLELEGEILPEELEVIRSGKKVYEAIVLANILTKEDLSSSMIEKYNMHKRQLAELKQTAKAISPDFYKALFKSNGIYEKFIKGTGNPAKVLTRDEFYKAIKKAFEEALEGVKFPDSDKDFDFSKANIDASMAAYLSSLSDLMKFDNFLPKQRMSDNGAIPYQVHEHELIKILEKQGDAFPFLLHKFQMKSDEAAEAAEIEEEYEIQQLFKFRIPYYVGTLAKEAGWQKAGNRIIRTDSPAKNSWVVRKSTQKLTPWNFDEVVDKEQSATNFIERMTNFDTYLPEEKVLPMNSLLYQEFKIFNELLNCGYRANGTRVYFDGVMRQAIFNDLFKVNKKVSGKQLIEYLKNKYQINVESVQALFGIDTFVKDVKFNTNYSTFIDLTNAGIDAKKIEDNRAIFEQIIKWQTIFTEEKTIKRKLHEANSEWQLFSKRDIERLSRKHYTGWGRLSEKMITGIRAENGKTIIENLKEMPYRNFMRLLEDKRIAEIVKNEQTKNQNDSGLTYDLIENLAGSPAIKKGIWQSLKIVSELEDYLGREKISKIVIEMSREHAQGRTKARKKQIDDFYKSFKEKTGEEISSSLKDELSRQEEIAFTNEKLFLYFMQNGRCMYSGQQLEISGLKNYEVDHIIPQTFVKDDSFNNKVLVLKKANQDKGGDTPTAEIISRMRSFWILLTKNGQVSKQKLVNLTTKSGSFQRMNDEKLKGFINRQLVENRQITKHVANILSDYFSENVEILTPKSAMTSQFRQGIVYVPKEDFDFENGKSYEFDGKFVDTNGGIQSESRYSSSKFVKCHYHQGFPKNRELNNYHHAHDAYLNAVVANYVYGTFPGYRKMWVYGEFQKDTKNAFGKFATQRKEKAQQLLTGMAAETWRLVDAETGEIMTHSRDAVLAEVERALGLRNVNIVKKTEVQTGKFGDESVYKKDEKAKNFANGLKNTLLPNQYGGTKAPISAFTVVVRNGKGAIKPLSISAMNADRYLRSADKLGLVQEFYPKEKITEIVVPKVPKYAKYCLPNGAVRLLASYQEAQIGIDLPMITIADKNSTEEETLESFDNLADFIEKNKLFVENKLNLLPHIRENFQKSDRETQLKIIGEMLRVTKGSNQNLKALQQAGLGTTEQRLKTGNAITNGTILIHESITGLYETRTTLD